MLAIVAKRYPQWGDFFTAVQLSRMALSSGGDLRDYFRMLRLAITRAPGRPKLPVPDDFLVDAEDAVRNDMLPIAAADRAWLARIMASHKPELPSLDALRSDRLRDAGEAVKDEIGFETFGEIEAIEQEVRRPSAQNTQGIRRTSHLTEHAFDGAELRADAAAGDRVRRGARQIHELARLGLELSRIVGQGCSHQVKPGQNQPAEKHAVAVQYIHRRCRARHDHERWSGMQRPRADQRRPAVRTELRRVLVGVGYAALLG